jgi:23S rRNA G2445 N2-methylase RlmL
MRKDSASDPGSTAVELERCVNDPGYTPGVGRLPSLLQGLADLEDEAAHKVTRALARAGKPAAEAALRALAAAPEKLRLRLLEVVRRVASETHDATLMPPLIDALADPSPRCRKLAASALGKLGHPEAEPALLAALKGAPLELQRVIAEALGKVGGESSRRALELLPATDADLARRVNSARLLLERRTRREEPSRIRLDRALPTLARVAAFCRAGLARLLADELARFEAVVVDPTRVQLDHSGSLAELLEARTALEVALLVELDTAVHPLEERIARALSSAAVVDLLQAWTEGLPRLRFAWSDAGHRRSLSWAVAEALSRQTQRVVNDPRRASWTARVASNDARTLQLIPRLDPDPRFAYRVRDVPAASHPTIAAALARVAGVRADDVVWDPFVGSALELIERARLGSYARLVGSDLEVRALEAARANLLSAGVERFELLQGDARQMAPAGVSLVICNPPMGRRVARDGSLGPLLDAFVVHAASVLAPGGRLVWLSPLAERSARIAARAALAVERGPQLDMGGFQAEIQVLRRPG